LGGISDVYFALKELLRSTLKTNTLQSFDLSRYLVNEIESIPERSLDMILASRKIDATMANDVLRDLGKFWLLEQGQHEDTEKPPEDSFVYQFRGLDAEQTADELEKNDTEAPKSKECPMMFKDLLDKVKDKMNTNFNHFKDDHLRATYHRIMSTIVEVTKENTPEEERLSYLGHCQEIASSLRKQPREVEKLCPILDQMKEFIAENVAPYNDEHPGLKLVLRNFFLLIILFFLQFWKVFYE